MKTVRWIGTKNSKYPAPGVTREEFFAVLHRVVGAPHCDVLDCKEHAVVAYRDGKKVWYYCERHRDTARETFR